MTSQTKTPIADRLYALVAASVMTLALLAGINHLAVTESAAPQMAQAAATQAV